MAIEIFFSPGFQKQVQGEVDYFREFLKSRCLDGARPSAAAIAAIGYAVKTLGQSSAKLNDEKSFRALLLEFVNDNFDAGVGEAENDGH